MNTKELTIPKEQLHKLLCAGSGDAMLLYCYLHSGNAPENAKHDLHMTDSRLRCAGATLRQLGLLPEKKPTVELSGERPQYTERDVMQAMDADLDFRGIYGEVQRVLGRNLNTEELKIILGFVRYLGLPGEVISVLISYCKDRARQKGGVRAPSLRTIEKEAYAWAERGIDSMEEAAAYIHQQNLRRSRLGRLMEILQIRGRNLSPSEERYANAWLEMGFDEEAIALAYDRTCVNTGGLSWAYMNKILLRWSESGLTTAEKIRAGDKGAVPKGASGALGAAELEAIQKVLQEA